MDKQNNKQTNRNTNGAANNPTEKIKRNFLELSPEKKAEALATLLELAESVSGYDPKSSKSLIAVHNTLRNLNEKQNGGKSDAGK